MTDKEKERICKKIDIGYKKYLKEEGTIGERILDKLLTFIEYDTKYHILFWISIPLIIYGIFILISKALPLLIQRIILTLL